MPRGKSNSRVTKPASTPSRRAGRKSSTINNNNNNNNVQEQFQSLPRGLPVLRMPPNGLYGSASLYVNRQSHNSFSLPRGMHSMNPMYNMKTSDFLDNRESNGNMSSSIDSDVDADGEEEFGVEDHHVPSSRMIQAHKAHHTAAKVAIDSYGTGINMESVLCKKVANEPALRLPKQRRPDQGLNVQRRSNGEALMAYITGQVPPNACKNCHKGHGPWEQCVVFEGQLCGSCANCWFNASGSRCTFHESNHVQPPPSQTPAPVYTPSISAVTPSSLSFTSTTGIDPSNISGLGLVPMPQAAASGTSVTSETNVRVNSTMTNNSNLMSNQNANTLRNWTIVDYAQHMVNTSFHNIMSLPKRDRYVIRIEAAAKELGLRMIEYEEYLDSQELMSDQNGATVASQSQANSESLAPQQSEESKTMNSQLLADSSNTTEVGLSASSSSLNDEVL